MKQLSAFRQMFEPIFSKYVKRKIKDITELHPTCLTLFAFLEEYTLRKAKRFRPFLCYLAYQAEYGDRAPPLHSELKNALMAIELFHTGTLIHDDVVDQDNKRRGKSSLHVLAAKLTKKEYKKAKQTGEHLAILLGNMLFGWANECMANISIPVVRRRFYSMYEKTNVGQVLDVMHFRVTPIEKSVIDTYKTSWYTVILPLQIGAGLAGANDARCIQYEAYGLSLGRAFQLRDDYLDNEISERVFLQQSKKIALHIEKEFATLHLSNASRDTFSDVVQFVLNRKQ